MAQLKEILRKIKSVQSTQKTTKAMKLVSTAKLRRAEEVARRSRAYAEKLNSVILDIAFQLRAIKGENEESIFFKPVTGKVVDILFITADKGLCGGFNSQTIKTVRNLRDELIEQGYQVRLRAIGKKGIEFFRFKQIDLLTAYTGVSSAPNYEKAQAIINEAVADFVAGKTNQIILVYNGYKNMITQELKQQTLLPVTLVERRHDERAQIIKEHINVKSSMKFEPKDEEEEILDTMIQKYIEYNLYYALVDSLAAEHSARMQAMDAATRNAKEMVNSLTINYNKARQESITTELVEIISGMEALR
ncbi:MAG: F0F1 ATP synthase subunit gamma [Campylobacterales bacterium]